MTRILIVDDDSLILVGLGNSFAKRGYEVFRADSGEAAVTLAESAQPDVVLMDIGLPGMSGTEAARRIQERRNVPVVFLSAHDSPKEVNAAIESGSLTYLVKPVTIKQLVPAIENALARAREMARLRSIEEHLGVALMQSRDISVAIGMLLERHGLSAEDAFAMLRTNARDTRRKTDDVARDVIAGTLQLKPQAGT